MADAPQPTVWTIKALLAWTTDFLAKKGIDSPRADAQILLGHVLGYDKTYLTVNFAEQPSEADRARFKDLIQRRVGGCPVAYLTGVRDFYLLPFEVTPAVLVPRPDTETLVAEAIAFLKPLAAPAVLDLGTGSGCIAVSVAHQKKDARVTAVDASADALDVAKRNATRHGVADRVEFLHGDLFAPLPAGAAFDLVVSNPPYIAQHEFAGLPTDVRDHEPRTALDGGPDGLDFYRRIAAGVGPFLKPGGRLLLEIGATQEADVRAVLGGRPELEVGPTLKDLARLPRVVTAKKVL
ncbi:MAG: peptide chain release factor N(5)-glutamine methyltransferase [Isosphaera sp.]|nr:peptide chain release factor N(5)-glutamine methyltransferase [Isosphaera sp.]